MRVLRRLYRWFVDVFGRRASPVTLAGVAFSEAIFFPVPPEVMLIPMSIARPERALFYAGITTLFSVLGACVGYTIGAYFMNSVGIAILKTFHLTREYQMLSDLYGRYGGIITFIAAFTPIPYKVISISSGALAFSAGAFIIASFIGRGFRYFLIALPFWMWGEKAENFVEKHLEKITVLISILLLGGVIVWKLVVKNL